MKLLSRAMKSMHAPVYAARLRELVRQIIPHLRDDDRVLDVGCGYGALGRALMDDPLCPRGMRVWGLERTRRGNEAIEVVGYDGEQFPFDDDSFDVVILADVLHHEEQPERLLGECARVARRFLIIKDHQRTGLLAQQRIAFMDWAANAPYGVPCLYRYYSPQEWSALLARQHLTVIDEFRSMRLYPQPFNLIFGGRLQYMAVTKVGPNGGSRGS